MKTFRPYVFVYGGVLIWTVAANMFPFSVPLDGSVKTENSRKTITGVFVEANLPIILFPKGLGGPDFSSLFIMVCTQKSNPLISKRISRVVK